MNPEDILKHFHGQMNKGGVLLRQPTQEELDLFIDRVMKERDETYYSMAQALAFKIERGVHSPAEAEIYPLVIKRLEERAGGQ